MYSFVYRFSLVLLVLVACAPMIFAAEAPVERHAGDELTNPIDGAIMAWVPGGTFTMGSPEGVGAPNERPAHQVTLTGFWIYKYEVTVAQYRVFCAATERELPPFPAGYSWKDKRGWDDQALQQHPIVRVTWEEAQAYATWAKASLPTEAQWEYAARGPEGHNYPWGGTATAGKLADGWDGTKCSNYVNSVRRDLSTWPRGSFPDGVTWCGAHDMAGNVWEWCAEWFDDYTPGPKTDPTGPTTGTRRVVRGGSWMNYGFSCRGAHRYGDIVPDDRQSLIGFRCVFVPQEL